MARAAWCAARPQCMRPTYGVCLSGFSIRVLFDESTERWSCASARLPTCRELETYKEVRNCSRVRRALETLLERRGINADTAMRLAPHFRGSAHFGSFVPRPEVFSG